MAQYRKEPQKDLQTVVEEATFDFTMGDHSVAESKLRAVVDQDPQCFEAWHALTEVLLAERRLDDAVEAGETALGLRPKDVHIHTSLSRIWVEKGDKAKAEHYGAQARILGWGEQIRDDEDPGIQV